MIKLKIDAGALAGLMSADAYKAHLGE